MTMAARIPTSPVTIGRALATASILLAADRATLAIAAGTTIAVDGAARDFFEETPVTLPDLIPGENYGVQLDAKGNPFASMLGPESPLAAGAFAGFHFAPGGNAPARTGGDDVPAINPASCWDAAFRATCQDPRGMTFDLATLTWLDIYLLCVDHRRHGTSSCGVAIADGRSLSRLNYKDAVEIYASHGKRLATYDELRSAAFGVTEKSGVERHPKTTGLDAARTSRIGLMQATGNVWQWCTDGDPDDPRPSLFGGSCCNGSDAGSRYAHLVYWPGASNGGISARGACDHLGPA